MAECAYRHCHITFEPKVTWQRFCSSAHKRAERKVAAQLGEPHRCPDCKAIHAPDELSVITVLERILIKASTAGHLYSPEIIEEIRETLARRRTILAPRGESRASPGQTENQSAPPVSAVPHLPLSLA